MASFDEKLDRHRREKRERQDEERRRHKEMETPEEKRARRIAKKLQKVCGCVVGEMG
jgi:hypothetical protein